MYCKTSDQNGNDPFADFERLIETAFRGNSRWSGHSYGASARAGSFRVNCYSDDNNRYVVAELPGFSKEGITVQLENGVLAIAAERALKEGDKAQRAQVRRELNVPEDVAAEKVGAKLENGLLRITLPKAEAAKPRTIAVN